VITYNFTSGGGTDKWAYESSNAGADPPATRDVAGETEFGSYTEIDSSNDTRYSTGGGGNGQEPSHHFNFSISEAPAQIGNIYVEWEGYGDNDGANFYIWNVTGTSYELVQAGTSTAADDVLSSNYASAADYIDGSGYLHLMSIEYQQGGTDTIYTDYVEVVVSLTGPCPAPTPTPTPTPTP
jgi:hypothetical protein